MWDLPGPGLEPVSPALAGRFFTTVRTGKSVAQILNHVESSYLQIRKWMPGAGCLFITSYQRCMPIPVCHVDSSKVEVGAIGSLQS